MSDTHNSEEIIKRGQSLYDQKIRAAVEPGNTGKYLIINVETGEYEMDVDDLAASVRARERFPHAPLFTLRVGHPTAYRLGSTRSLGRS